MRLPFPRPMALLLLPLLAACHTTRRAAQTISAPERTAIIAFAKKQLGNPYKYAGATPREGFDCSGFVSYVFAHFGVALPRTSAAQAGHGRSVPLKQARPGDLIFFTGRDAGSGQVGHVGIITRSAGPDTEFIHASTSSGVVLSLLSADYYRRRFIKAVSLLR